MNTKTKILLALVVLIAIGFGAFQLKNTSAAEPVDYDGKYVPNPPGQYINTVIAPESAEEVMINNKSVRLVKMVGHEGGKIGNVTKEGRLILFNLYKDILLLLPNTNVFTNYIGWTNVIYLPQRLDVKDIPAIMQDDTTVKIGPYTESSNNVLAFTVGARLLELKYNKDVYVKMKYGNTGDIYRIFGSTDTGTWKVLDGFKVDSKGYLNIKLKDIPYYLVAMPMSAEDYAALPKHTKSEALIPNTKTGSYCYMIKNGSNKVKNILVNKKLTYRDMIHELGMRYHPNFSQEEVSEILLPHGCKSKSESYIPYFQKAKDEQYLARKCKAGGSVNKYDSYKTAYYASELNQVLHLDKKLHRALFDILTVEDQLEYNMSNVSKVYEKVGRFCSKLDMIDDAKKRQNLRKNLKEHYDNLIKHLLQEQVQNRRNNHNSASSMHGSASNTCSDLSCLDSNFRSCNPKTAEIQIDENTIYNYDIKGDKNGLCEMKTMFLAHNNEELVDKSMTCLYDNGKSFLEAVIEVHDSLSTTTPLGQCTGELFNELIEE